MTVHILPNMHETLPKRSFANKSTVEDVTVSTVADREIIQFDNKRLQAKWPKYGKK